MGDTRTAQSLGEAWDSDATTKTFAESDLVVVSNREPYQHEWDGDDIEVTRPNGGVTAGIDEVLRTLDGTWIAWGDGSADDDVVDDDDRVTVPPDADGTETYTLERVWLTDEQVENYYLGFSNRVLWPLCHSALTRIRSEPGYWEQYTEVNGRFADAVVEQIDGPTVAWLQDYHFGLAPRMVRLRTDDDVFLAHFWHIPWPGEDVFRACPHAEELLRGLLGNDLLGFHTERYSANFLRCADALLDDADVDWHAGRVIHKGGETTVRAFPLGVPADRIRRAAVSRSAAEHWSRFAVEHGIDEATDVALGVDRLDYTKGIPERLDALERLWETDPEARGAFTYVQVGTESRSEIPAYRELQETVAGAVDRINDRFGTDDWQPVVYTTDRLTNEALYALYRRADVALVSPIRDGMNLVAQEYVAAQVGDDGVLVLSDQAGAHERLGDDALTVVPQETDGFARTIRSALSLPADERRERMRALRRQVHEADLSAWTDAVLAAMADHEEVPDGETGERA